MSVQTWIALAAAAAAALWLLRDLLPAGPRARPACAGCSCPAARRG